MPFDFDSNEHAARGTKNLLIIILNGVLISSIIFYKNKDILKILHNIRKIIWSMLS